MPEVSLELLEAKIEAINARLEGMDRAITLARHEMDGRLQHLNELRREVLEDRRTFVTDQVFQAKMDRIEQERRNIWLSVLSVLVSAATLVFVISRTFY